MGIKMPTIPPGPEQRVAHLGSHGILRCDLKYFSRPIVSACSPSPGTGYENRDPTGNSSNSNHTLLGEDGESTWKVL